MVFEKFQAAQANTIINNIMVLAGHIQLCHHYKNNK